MKNLIPHFIQEQYLDGNTHGRIEAYTLFVDLSGFTPLTEALMRQGTRGAEQLSNVLNDIFEPLVRMVYSKGGFIPYFAGDAFTAIFPAEGQPMGAKEIIQGAMLARNLFSQRQFRFGNFTIGIKFGLSYGTVEWGIVGVGAKAFYFRGAPVDGCAACQVKAMDKDIVIDEALRQNLPKGQFALMDLEAGFYKIKGGIPSKESSIISVEQPPIERGVAMQFLPDAVARYNQEGEFRTVISVFISFEGVETHALLNDFASIILEQINNFSGYFKEIDYGDKGGVMVGFFGAPVSFENNNDRALEFISAIREELRGLQSKSSLRYRAGMTIGTAYTGIVGGVERCQYAAVGNRVNLAARLMTYAAWDEVLVDEEIQKNHHFHFLNRGDIEYKGIKGLVPTFRLVGRNYEAHTSYSGDMVGREPELQGLLDFSSPLFEGASAGIAYIYGEAGIGKSRLVHELKNVLYGQQLVYWHTCQSDQILKKPFNPFIYFLKNYFEQYPESTSLANIQNFEGRFNQLLEDLSKAERPEALYIRRELIRTRTVLAALIGLNFQNSIWDQLDAKGRYQNTLSAIINLLVAESLIRHESGIDILAVLPEPNDWRVVRPEQVARLARALAETHEYVVVDTPGPINEVVAAALCEADVILLVTSLEMSSIKDTKTAVRVLGSLGVDSGRIRLVINDSTSASAITPDDVAEATGLPVATSIPHDRQLGRSVQRGVPVYLEHRGGTFPRAIADLAGSLAGVTTGSRRRRLPFLR